MRPTEARKAIEDLRASVRTVGKLEPLLLDALARDEMDSRPDSAFAGRISDKVHDHVRGLCRALANLCEVVVAAHNTATQLQLDEPGGRLKSVPDCLACGDLALPRPRGGFCKRCATAYYRRTRHAIHDRAAFIAARQRESTESTALTSTNVPANGAA